MPSVMAQTTLGIHPKAEVWPLLIDFEHFASAVEGVVSVSILERSDTSMVSSWEVMLDGSKLTWTERDALIAPNRIEFQQIDGDLAEWRGAWELTEVDGELTARRIVDFDIGIPALAGILDPIGRRAIEANSHRMLDALRHRVSEQGAS